MKYIIAFLITVNTAIFTTAFAQSQVAFNFQVEYLNDQQYKFFIELSDPERVQFIDIGFIIDDTSQGVVNENFFGSLNKKLDGNYYFSIEAEEFKIVPSEGFSLVLESKFLFADVPIKRYRSVSIKCLDRNFNDLGTNYQVIQ